MKVAMVSEHASPLAALGGEDAGGQNVHVAALAAAMARRGAQVVVHTRRDDPGLPRRVRAAPGVAVDHVPAGPARPIPKDELLPYMDHFAAELAECWAVECPDVVHAHFWMSGRAALRAADELATRPRVIQTFHALGVVKRRYQGARDTSPPGRLAQERSIIRRADRVIATCRDEVFELLGLGIDPENVAVIPCGVELALFRPEGPSEPRESGLGRLVTVGRLVERKGVGDVIAALAELPGVELVVAGGPEASALAKCPEARRLQALAESLGVDDRVHLRGRIGREAVPPLLRSADVAVCTPWYEPFGIVPLEAMACGVPVVASAVGGLIDSVVDGLTGVHVRPREPRWLARVLRSLLADRERRMQLGAAGARRAAESYGWDGIARATLAEYASVLAAARTPQEVVV